MGIMFKITYAERLNEQVKLMRFDAPLIAAKARPGQFVMLRIDESGERIPLTIADQNEEEGTITLVFQEVGKTTMQLGTLSAGDYIADLVGPLGLPSELSGYKRVCVIGGGLGCAIAYPQAKALNRLGAEVDVIAGFRNSGLIFFEKEMGAVSRRLIVTTDDGSNGRKGLVTDALKELIEGGAEYDAVIAIGPIMMMKYVSLLTKQYGIKTIVSMNPLMVDGTGMCGCCRVTVGGVTKFACVDGPDFDGHAVDYDEALRRCAHYKDEEQHAIMSHKCRMSGKSESEAAENA
jgi:ferredoxin--NADP+ reductase